MRDASENVRARRDIGLSLATYVINVCKIKFEDPGDGVTQSLRRNIKMESKVALPWWENSKA